MKRKHRFRRIGAAMLFLSARLKAFRFVVVVRRRENHAQKQGHDNHDDPESTAEQKKNPLRSIRAICYIYPHYT